MRTHLLVAAAAALILSGCSSLDSLNPFGDEPEVPLEGQRISVLELDQGLVPDPQLQDAQVALPAPQTNPDWPQPGGYPSHVLYHLALPDSPRPVWQTSIGAGSSDPWLNIVVTKFGTSRRLLAQPVVADGVVYAMNTRSQVVAVDAQSGRTLWSQSILPEHENDALGGGVAYSNGRVFATTGAAEALALDARTGEILWRVGISAPSRAGPTVADGRVLALNVENELHALDADTGRRLWSHTGVGEPTGLLGGASPAVDRGVVVVPHTSGEIVALRAENGRPLWTDALASMRRINPAATLTDIRGHPAIDGGVLFAVSNSGRMAAIDMRSGARLWDLDIGAIQTPWVAGDYVYILTNGGVLAAVLRESGRVRWATSLDQTLDEDDREDGVIWTGPVLAGDRLIVAGSHGMALSVSPYNGEVLGRISLPGGVTIPPVVANGTLYILSDDGELVALR